MVDKKTSETLVLLISNSNVLQERDLEEAVQIAERLDVPLDRAITMSGISTEKDLELPMRAIKLVQDGKMTIDQAVATVRLVSHAHLSFDDAVNNVRAQSEGQTQSYTSLPGIGEIGKLLKDAGIITVEHLKRAVEQSLQSAMPVGRMLRLNRDVSSLMLNSAINGHLLIRDRKASREQVLEALKLAFKKKASIEQALFELGNYTQPGSNELKLSDLFSMANLITEGDRLECLELEVISKKPIGQILTEQGLVNRDLLETAIHLQGTVASDTVRAYQAAEALRRVETEKISVYQALAELRSGDQGPPMRLGDLLVATEFATTQQIESALKQSSDSNIKIGKVLLQAQIITEQKLFAALRCQSLVKFGFVSDAQAIAALRQSERNGGSLEDAFNGMAIYAPTSMQWSWV